MNFIFTFSSIVAGRKIMGRKKRVIEVLILCILILTACSSKEEVRVQEVVEDSSIEIGDESEQETNEFESTKDIEEESKDFSPITADEIFTMELSEKYIGHRYKGNDISQFTDFQHIEGMMLDRGQGFSDEYGLTSFAIDENGRVSFLNKLTHRDQGGNPYWEVLDVLYILMHEGYKTSSLILRYGEPLQGVALFNNSEGQAKEFYDVLRVWKVNWDTMKFEEIPNDGTKVYDVLG